MEEQKRVAESIGATQDEVIAALIPELVEDTLDLEEIFAINGHAEVETIKAKYVPCVPTA